MTPTEATTPRHRRLPEIWISDSDDDDDDKPPPYEPYIIQSPSPPLCAHRSTGTMRVTPALAPLLPTTSVQISTTPPTPCPTVQPPAVPFSHSSRRFCSRKTRVNYLSGPGTKPEDLVVPQLGTTILGYYVVTIGEQTGIFYRWNTVKSLTSGVPGNAQQRYDSWEEAIAAYTDDYNNGHVETRVVIRSGHSTSDTLADLTARLNLD